MAILTQQDLDLPAGINAAGNLISAKDLVERRLKSKNEQLSLSDLPEKERRAVVIARLEKKDDYGFLQLAGGPISKEDALRAVQEGTPLGKVVEDLEMREVRIVERELTKLFQERPAGKLISR